MIESNWTRKRTEEYLSELGIEGAAVEAILKETATKRHAHRVSRTFAAAVAGCSRNSHVETEGGVTAPNGLGCTECLIRMIADLVGVGGHQGCSGDGTARHPAFSHLGTGRKRAGDGRAWMAALDAAIYRSIQAGREDCASVEVGPGDVWTAVGEEPRWCRSLAREGLRRAVGLTPWHELVGVVFTGPAEEWARVLNRAEAAISAGQWDQTISDAYRTAFYAHPARDTDPALAECSAKEDAAALVPAGVTGTWDSEGLTFTRDVPSW